MPAFKDLLGKSFGKWLVVGYGGSESGFTRWVCVCECGTERAVFSNSLLSGRSTSCGCAITPRVAHGHKCGGQQSPTYMTWRAMLRRCGDSKSACFKDYGGRGIKVCEQWKSFEAFLSDMGERPKGKNLDRIDCDGDYTVENCRWTTNKENNNNRRNNRRLEFNGQTLTVSQWADVLGIRPATIYTRLFRGDSIEQALRPLWT
jgi:hypothetical protein